MPRNPNPRIGYCENKFFTPSQIRDRARQLQNVMVRRADKLSCVIAARIRLCPSATDKIALAPHAHVGVIHNVKQAILREVLTLLFARSLHTLANGCRGFTYSVVAEVFIIHPRDFNTATPYQLYRARDQIFFSDISFSNIAELSIPPLTTMGSMTYDMRERLIVNLVWVLQGGSVLETVTLN